MNDVRRSPRLCVSVLAIHREMYLLPHKSESHTQLDKELADVRQQTVLQFPLGDLSAKRQKIEVVRVAHDLVRKIGLRRRQRLFEIGHRLALAGIQI